MYRRLAILRSCLAIALTLAGVGAASAAHPLTGDKQEQALLGSLEQEKFIRAREQAEAILRRHPDSLIARFGLGRVFFEEEGNLPRALYHVRRAEKLLTSRYGARPSEPLAQRWHRQVLLKQEEILGEMDRRSEQLELLDRYDALYQPKQDHRRIWPLMKLHRFDEAIRIAKELTRSSEQVRRISGYNGLLSVEFERGRPRECFRVALQAVESTAYQSCVLALNAAEAAFAVFKFSEVERLAQKSIQAPSKDCPASAHSHLANLYLMRADFQRAISAVKAARSFGVERRHRQQFEASIGAWLVRLLYALGQFDKAHELASRIVRAPDRVGLTSFSSELMELLHTADLHATLQAKIETLRERASARPLGARLKLWVEINRLKIAAWAARHKATTLLARGKTFEELMRPFLKPYPPWMTPALIEIAGSGVTKQAISIVRGREQLKRETAPYHDAWLAESAYRAEDWPGALKIARRALDKLPNDEVLLRGRVLALAADVARRLGKVKLAREYFDAVLYRWPTALRLLGIQLPVKIAATGGELARRVAQRLVDSRRLLVANIGFDVRVEQVGRHVRSCLSGPRGRRYACATVEGKTLAGKQLDEQVALVIDAFHQEVFSPKVDLTQQDINSLDGSAVRGRADQVLKEVLGK